MPYEVEGVSFVVTFTGDPQRLTDGTAYQDTQIRDVTIQPDENNVNKFYVGFSSSVETTGIRMPAPVAGEPCPPHPIRTLNGRCMAWVKGTAGEKARVNAMRYGMVRS